MDINNRSHASTTRSNALESTTDSSRLRKVKSAGDKRSDSDFYFGKLIGEGSFSSVYLAKDIHTDKEYAIKTCEKFLIKKERKAESIIREKEVMNLLNINQSSTAPFFVKLFYTFKCETKLYFVMTYCKNGELLKWIKKVGNFDRKSAAFYSAEIVRALEHMHSLNIIHRDMKPENILLDDQMHIKITDFGSAKLLKDTGDGGPVRRNSFDGTAQYVSPEVLKSKDISGATDLWAFGCILYQMISGLPPFNSQSEYLIFRQVLSLDYEFPEGFDVCAKDLVQRLLVLESCERLGAQEKSTYSSIRSHNFFESLDFESLHKQTPPEICGFVPELESQDGVWRGKYSPGLNSEALQRIEFSDSPVSQKQHREGIEHYLYLTKEEMGLKLADQKKSNPYYGFVEGNLVLKQGLLDKRKGLFPRRRMFLLTTGPKLYYVDPVAKVLKGQVPWGPTLVPDPKDFKTFCVHTPNRTYYLQDPSGSAHEWCQALEIVRDHYYSKGS